MELCFLADKHDPPVNDEQKCPGMYWRPDGEVVDKIDSLAPLRTTASVFMKSNEHHMNVFVLTRDVAHKPFGEIDVLTNDERSVDGRLLGIRSHSGKPPLVPPTCTGSIS